MSTHWKLWKVLIAASSSILLLTIMPVVCASFSSRVAIGLTHHTGDLASGQSATPRAPMQAGAPNPAPPTQTAKLVFIHHSVGGNWLTGGNGDLGEALGENNYYISDTYYGWGPADLDVGEGTIGDHTHIGYWYNWFVGPHRDTYLSALYATTARNATYIRPMADPGGENEIVMLKSCFPDSLLRGSPDDPPTVGENPLRGRRWDEQVDGEYVHTVGNAKGIYNDLLTYLATRQDKLFVVITAPPHICCPSMGANARALNNWLVHDWLTDYPYRNVAVFDFFSVLTTNGGDASTNDYGRNTGNHHRLATATTPITVEHITDGDDDDSPDTLEYPTEGGTNPHPSSAGNQKATGEFVPLLNAYYNCWKHGECWQGAADWIAVTSSDDTVSVYPGETATYSMSVTASAGISDPVTLSLQGAPSGATIAFVPNPVVPPRNSQLRITVAASTIVGTYPMTVTATSGRVTGTTALTLTIEPKITLGVRPNVATALPGDTVAFSLSVTASAGFGSPVTLALDGAPTGAAVSFIPDSVTPPATSQLRVATAASTIAGTYPMTVTGAFGRYFDTEHVALIVASPAPSFTLSISPTAQAAKPNQTAHYKVSVIGMNGFSLPVSLTVVGLPIGVSATWEVNPVTPGQPSMLRLLLSSRPPFGDHLMHVVGTADTQVVTRSIRLRIDRHSCYLPIVLR